MKKLVASFIMIFSWSFCVAQGDQQESDLKAAFLYNFTKYIDWETEPDSDEFVIGVLGSSSIVQSLNSIARNSTVKSKRIVIRTLSRPEEISNCNILYISQKNSYALQNILSRVNRGTLTISEQPGLARDGTAFNFILLNEKLRFEANLRAISSTGLKVSSQLLKLAIIVE